MLCCAAWCCAARRGAVLRGVVLCCAACVCYVTAGACSAAIRTRQGLCCMHPNFEFAFVAGPTDHRPVQSTARSPPRRTNDYNVVERPHPPQTKDHRGRRQERHLATASTRTATAASASDAVGASTDTTVPGGAEDCERQNHTAHPLTHGDARSTAAVGGRWWSDLLFTAAPADGAGQCDFDCGWQRLLR